MEWELIVLLLTICSVMGYGFFPVIIQMREEKHQSPWAYVQVEEKVDTVLQKSAATQDILNVDIPNFNNLEEFVAVPNFNDVHTKVSVPSDEIWSNIEVLVNEVVKEPSNAPLDYFDTAIANDTPEEYLPTLSPEQYNGIFMRFGEKVANLITCTPYKGTLGGQIMIGQFFKENNSIQFDGDWVELNIEIPIQMDGEFIVVKGNFLENGQFFVQHWEDPEMIDAGYSEEFELPNALEMIN